MARSAAISPMTGANLKPCPEQAETIVTFVGMFAVPPVFGLIADHTGTYAWSWLALAAWAAVGVVISLAVRDSRTRGTAPG